MAWPPCASRLAGTRAISVRYRAMGAFVHHSFSPLMT